MKSLSIISEKSGSQEPRGCSTEISAAGDAPHQGEFGGTAAVVTLGCAKNQVDSEVMLGAP